MIDVKLILDKINTRKITIAEIVRAITLLIENNQYQDVISIISRLKVFNSPKLWDAINTHLPAKLINDILQHADAKIQKTHASRKDQQFAKEDKETLIHAFKSFNIKTLKQLLDRLKINDPSIFIEAFFYINEPLILNENKSLSLYDYNYYEFISAIKRALTIPQLIPIALNIIIQFGIQDIKPFVLAALKNIGKFKLDPITFRDIVTLYQFSDNQLMGFFNVSKDARLLVYRCIMQNSDSKLTTSLVSALFIKDFQNGRLNDMIGKKKLIDIYCAFFNSMGYDDLITRLKAMNPEQLSSQINTLSAIPDDESFYVIMMHCAPLPTIDPLLEKRLQSLSPYGRALFSSRTMQEKQPNIVAALDSLVPTTDIAPNITQKEPSHGISFELPVMNESVDELLDFEDLPERLEPQPTTLRSSQLKEIISQFIFCLGLIKCC